MSNSELEELRSVFSSSIDCLPHAGRFLIGDYEAISDTAVGNLANQYQRIAIPVIATYPPITHSTGYPPAVARYTAPMPPSIFPSMRLICTPSGVRTCNVADVSVRTPIAPAVNTAHVATGRPSIVRAVGSNHANSPMTIGHPTIPRPIQAILLNSSSRSICRRCGFMSPVQPRIADRKAPWRILHLNGIISPAPNHTSRPERHGLTGTSMECVPSGPDDAPVTWDLDVTDS